MYPTLKEVALAGSPGSKAMKQVSQQIMTVSLKAAGEGNIYVTRVFLSFPDKTLNFLNVAFWQESQSYLMKLLVFSSGV